MSIHTDEDFGLNPVRARLLEAEGIRHGFFTRHGGVSRGIYRGLNAGTGSKDDPESVKTNRARIAAHLGISSTMLVSPWQVHSADAILVDAPFCGVRPQADAIVTARPGLAVSVLTADCGPLLFADAEAGVVAAAHAGWKGALGGIVESTVEAMVRAGARRDRIGAVLGPTISQKNYEVGPEFLERFLAIDRRCADCFRASSRPGHGLFDLPRFILGRLAEAGISAEHIDACTYEDEASYYSYRRSTHRGESDYGRQISAIAWMGN